MTEVHPSITRDRVLNAMNDYRYALDNPGFCLACGNRAEGVEPDAREYECEACGETLVYGAEEILLMQAYHGCPTPSKKGRKD